MPELNIGDKAPEFTLPDQDSAPQSLSDYAGEWVLIYFYPKDMTPGCTKEACALRDNYDAFKKINATIFGVSADSPARHQKFIEKENLPFSLLSDEKKEMLESYNVWAEKNMYGRKYMGILRHSYLINPEGSIAKIYKKVKPPEHAEEVLRDLEALRAT
jgi:peroxiredoxin Q/BCP